jgi:hypothetical protein
MEVIKNGLEDIVVGDCVVVVKVVVGTGLFVNVETFYGIEVGAFFSGNVISAWSLVCFQM